MTGVAARLESAGYDSAWVYDHFHTVPEPSQEATYEAWTLMAALAAATSTIRLGQMCTCNSYRPTPFLAKIASCIDVISGGRLEFGEAVQIIKKMWMDDEATFKGKYYEVAGAINQPKPLQRPHPPLWIAGGGEKLTLRLVAEHADYANFAGALETFVAKSEILDGHCEAVGRDPAEIGRTVHMITMVGADEAAVARAAEQGGRTADEYRASGMTLIGSADEVAERLAAYRDAGCTYFMTYFPDAAWGNSIEAYAESVIPALR
jgi:alkanesulfonate monooxygenase SsuD/methylene tetrahydromethanopterin reductase-like flavin-dependent oxidoreductase (luciferase family)